MSGPFVGIGAGFEIDGHVIPKCKKVNFPNFDVQSIETTNLDNLDYGKTFFPGLIDCGNIEVECQYDETVYDILVSLIRVVATCAVTDPATALREEEFDGFITKLGVEFEPDKESMIKFTVKVSGLPSESTTSN